MRQVSSKCRREVGENFYGNKILYEIGLVGYYEINTFG